jgi:uncharacterized protein
MLNEYEYLIKDILNNKEFNKIENIEHHGTTRMIHSKRVSYYSYSICKFLHLDYVSAARAGLLHDFFLSEAEMKKRTRITSLFTHSKKALKNSSKIFCLNEKEENIIVSHMFPLGIHLPVYMESWIVSTVDKVVGTYEFLEKLSVRMYYSKVALRSIVRIFN